CDVDGWVVKENPTGVLVLMCAGSHEGSAKSTDVWFHDSINICACRDQHFAYLLVTSRAGFYQWRAVPYLFRHGVFFWSRMNPNRLQFCIPGRRTSLLQLKITRCLSIRTRCLRYSVMIFSHWFGVDVGLGRKQPVDESRLPRDA